MYMPARIRICGRPDHGIAIIALQNRHAGEVEDEQRGDDPDDRMDFGRLLLADLDDAVGDEARGDAVGDRVRE